MKAFLFIGVGAICGAWARYGIGCLYAYYFSDIFPWGTAFINIIGCLLMGVSSALLNTQVGCSVAVQWSINIGFLGAYTTFSTYALEVVQLLDRGCFLSAMIYFLGSNLLGLLALYIGRQLVIWWAI